MSVKPNMLIESLLEGVETEKKDNIRTILESEARYISTLNEATFSGNIAHVPKLILPLARRVMTNVIADKLVGVQPLKEKTGICIAMKYVYSRAVEIDMGSEDAANAEAARYNAMIQGVQDAKDATVDGSKVTYPAGAEVAYVAGVAEKVFRRRQFDDNGNEIIPSEGEKVTLSNVTHPDGILSDEVTIDFVQTTATARTRKLQAQWTMEASQDAQSSLGINVEKELISAMAQTIANDIDRELINTIESKVGIAVDYKYSTVLSDSVYEKYQALYTKVLEVSNHIAMRNRRGAANWMIVNPKVLTVLQSLKSFNFAPSSSNYVDPTNVGLAGTIDGRFKVYTDIIRYSDDILLGYKGPSETDAGIFYMPYVPLEVSPTILDGDTFQPRVQLSTRYAIVSNLLGASAYYGKVIVDLDN